MQIAEGYRIKLLAKNDPMFTRDIAEEKASLLDVLCKVERDVSVTLFGGKHAQLTCTFISNRILRLQTYTQFLGIRLIEYSVTSE